MRLSGVTGSSHSFGARALSTPKLDTGGFSSLLENLKKASEVTAAETVKDSIELENHEIQLQLVYEHLSDSSKNVLERLKLEKNDLRKDEWLGLCQELKDAGAITQCDFDYTRPDLHLIPIGHFNKNGKFIKYSTPPIVLEELLSLSEQAQAKSSGKREIRISTGSWRGNPLEYLNEWSSMLYDWRSSMARRGTADGIHRYRSSDFSPIDEQINSCRKVSGLIRQLTAISGQERSL